MAEWSQEPSSNFRSKFRKFEKKHKNEAVNLINNLDTVFETLQSGVPMSKIRAGYIHNERRGVLAVDQRVMTGGSKVGKRGMKESRLYFYPDEENHVLHLITIGDKKSQSVDVNESHAYVEKLKNT